LKKITLTILTIVITVILVAILSPTSLSISNEPCARCHGSRYYQYLDILETDSQSQLPSAINLGETKTVKVVIQNDVNTGTYATLTSVLVTLTSAKGHLSVNTPTINIETLQPGTTTASWQITSISDGYDYLTIQASAINTHYSYFSDSYSSAIKVGQPVATTEPTSTPTQTPAPTNPQTTQTPPASTPTPTVISTPTNHPTSQPSPTPSNQNQTPLLIQLLNPTQNQKLNANTKHDIQWTTNGGTSPLNVTINYTSENEQNHWINIATNLPSNGKYSWTTPNEASSYRIQVRAQDSSTITQTSSTEITIEITNTNNPEVPIIPIITVFIITTVLVIGVFIYRKRRKSYS